MSLCNAVPYWYALECVLDAGHKDSHESADGHRWENNSEDEGDSR